MIDRQDASSYVLGYEADMPIVIPGTTSLGISARVLSELRSSGTARLTLIYSHKLASIECILTRVSNRVMMPLIVEDRIAEIPSLHARAQCGEGARTASGDFYFANDLNQPLLIESFLTFSWETKPRTERITRVIDGQRLHPDMEQSLKTVGKYDAYGLRFDFDSAELALNRSSWCEKLPKCSELMTIGKSRSSAIRIQRAVRNTTLDFPTGEPSPCGWLLSTMVSNHGAFARKAAAILNPKPTMTPLPGALSIGRWNFVALIEVVAALGHSMRDSLKAWFLVRPGHQLTARSAYQFAEDSAR